ncbi:MAG TPA: class I SAM-dependent methyltransferase [Gammaproteobacteria bacterium]|nr:class I SAM-dependent methyltransferase [Gammaproteobacteria bacterium]
MPSLAVIKVMLRELTTRERVPRTPEPDLVMDDPDKVRAYTRAGREDGVMASVYLFHCAQICEVLQEGDLALDLGCGPATQLAQVARLNPGASFTGVDLSEEMLTRARTHVRDMNLTNVDFHRASMTDLAEFKDASVDAVFSTVALHHLPDQAHLQRTFEEVARVLKPGGGVYLVDFGRLHSERSIQYFAYQYADRQPELFTLDYLYSLRAAFSYDDFREASRALHDRAILHGTFLMPFMVALKSSPRGQENARIKDQIEDMRKKLPNYHQVDLKDLLTFFRLGGVTSAYLK